MAPVVIMIRIIISYKIGTLFPIQQQFWQLKLKVLKILQNWQKAKNRKKNDRGFTLQ